MHLNIAESRIEVIGQEEFNPREWLRREVLWGYLMIPYSKLYETWTQETSRYHYYNDVSRRDVHANYINDSEMQAKAFVNHGKVIAGLLASSIMFNAMRSGLVIGYVDILELHAGAVDKSIRPSASPFALTEEIVDRVHEDCTMIARSVPMSESHKYHNSKKLVRASNLLSRLASGEIETWLAAASQDESHSLPVLEITDGGNARSVGDRVDFLNPIFHSLVNSEVFIDLQK